MDRLGTGGGGPSHHHQQPHSSHRRNTIDETQGKDTRVLSKAKGIMLHIRGCLGSSSPRARWAKRALYACIALYALLSLVAYSSTGLDSHYGDGGGVLSQQLQQQHQQQKQPQPGEPLDLEQRREGRSRGDSVVSSHRRRGRTGAREQQRQEKEEEDEEEEEEEVEETWMFEGEEGEEEDEEEEDGGWDPLAEDYEVRGDDLWTLCVWVCGAAGKIA